MPSYTLKQLGQLLGVKAEVRSPRKKGAPAPQRKQHPNRRKGWEAARRNSLLAFKTLMDIRGGGFDDGCRNYAAMIYAELLKLNGVSRWDACRAIDQMGEQCRPPLSQWRRRGGVKSGFKARMRKIKYQTMADLFEIRPEESEIISQKIGKPFPAASHFGRIAPVKNQAWKCTRASKQAARRRAITSIIENAKVRKLPSLRAMKALLFSRSVEASHVTIRADYKALGFVAD
jgi:hypothetical protein